MQNSISRKTRSRNPILGRETARSYSIGRTLLAGRIESGFREDTMVAGMEMVEKITGGFFMKIPMKKVFLLYIYCLTRQAQRSIDFTLHSTWEEFRQFYEDWRVQMLESVVDSLRRIAPRCERRPTAAEVFGGGFFWAICYPLNCWLNRWRTVWRFRPDEVQFMLQSIAAGLEIVKSAQRPDLLRTGASADGSGRLREYY